LFLAYNGRGSVRDTRGDLDGAIADYDVAIRLFPRYAIAFNNRGYAYKAKGDLKRAIDDYDEAIRLNPREAVVFTNRGDAYYGKGDPIRAVKDFDTAIQLSPSNPVAHRRRGAVRLSTGSPVEALVDLKQAFDLDPKNAYSAIWLSIAEQRSDLPSGLAQRVAFLDMAKWPAPIVRLFQGSETFDRVIAAAIVKGDPVATAGQICEAQLYGGLFALLQRAKDEASRHLKLAATTCPLTHLLERTAANAELVALTP
jgi:lipoprotein NlpI